MVTPSITVLLPVYNAQPYLADAIESILAQSFADFELLIIDDGSTDSSCEVVRAFSDQRIRFFSQSNRGLAATLNLGVRIASGRLIARMDADDISESDRLMRQYAKFQENGNLVLLGSGVNYIDCDGAHICRGYPVVGSSNIKTCLLRLGNVIAHPTAMFRRDTVLAVGGYSEEIGQYYEDLHLWRAMTKCGAFDNLAAPLLRYRVLASSVSNRVAGDPAFKKVLETYMRSGGVIGEAEYRSGEQLGTSSSAESLASRVRLLQSASYRIERVMKRVPLLSERQVLSILSKIKSASAYIGGHGNAS